MKRTILITAGTGNIGSELTALLASNPQVKEVRVGTRNPEASKSKLLKDFNKGIVKPVKFDLEDSQSIIEAVKGVDSLCLITPLSDTMVEYQETVIQEAKKQGVDYIVKVSVDVASPEAQEGPGAAHWAGEENIRGANIKATMLRPTIFMQHLLIVPGVYEKGDDTFYLPTGDGKMALLDCRDIALATAALLTDPSKSDLLDEDYFMLTGPETLTAEEIKQELSKLSKDKPFAHEASEEAFIQHSNKTNSPLELKGVYEAGKNGAFSTTYTSTFEKMTGKRPNSFARFAWDHRYYFQ
ncbi:NmrA family NAD(P)-binding protein [Aquimarina sp. U1-2]|uniref:NmrA family NAD(P)-binding protein n=1 Tax=Aquimarina sp. U1-2 TaxID=2823141 RepID=UPI001AEC7805|nr:NmrA family NAD(P)-binding protein [Aquimarina sp. U1-2]MBP2833767.1 NmrA family NAD(P)-binding protein [Aquimarina sp. U1-2]